MALTGDALWKAKIAAFLHDPPEKAGVLFHAGAGGHERVAAEHRAALGLSDEDFHRYSELAKRADHIASGADRPPMTKDEWERIDFQRQPQVVHPLSGVAYLLGSLETHAWNGVTETVRDAMDRIKQSYSGPHERFSEWARRAIALWRELPEFLTRQSGSSAIGHLWRVMPADTRSPDHSIWDHLRLTSALAGAMGDQAGKPNGEAALLIFTLGPVQPFIAAARKTPDLWAGSWILSWLAWSAMRPVAEALGPDSIVFPDLRGQPLVDLWLLREVGLGQLDEQLGPDPIELARASLPNRFLAVVPAERGRELGELSSKHARDALVELGGRTIEQSLSGTQVPETTRLRVAEQLREYLETRWVAVPWMASFADTSTLLRQAYGSGVEHLPGLALQETLKGAEVPFWRATHSGPLYGEVYGLTERMLGASKRIFDFPARAIPPGSRCAQTGELDPVVQGPARPGDRDALPVSPHLAEGEKLSSVVLIKRELRRTIGGALGLADEEVRKLHFPSTGSIAAAPYLEQLAERDPALAKELANALDVDSVARDHGQAVPARTNRVLQQRDLRGIGHLDARALFAEDGSSGFVDDDGRSFSDGVCKAIKKIWEKHGRPTPYYALVLADGDSMGAWLSGEKAPPLSQVLHRSYLESWPHSARREIEGHKRPLSPALHAAISSALRTFAGDLVPKLFERYASGKLIYSGGDDVLALIPLSDLTAVLEVLPRIFSGTTLPADLDWFGLSQGFAVLGRQPMPLMGSTASLSAGVVVAHQKAPFASVLAAARSAERAAKGLTGKAALTLSILKHSGERLDLTAPWVWGDSSDCTTASLLGTWVRAFGDGIELGGKMWRISPRYARAWALEIAPLFDAVPRAGSIGIESVRQVCVSLVSRHAERPSDIEASDELTSGPDQAAVMQSLVTPTLEFAEAVAARRGQPGVNRASNDVTPAALVGLLLEAALFLARHRNSIRGGVRREDASR